VALHECLVVLSINEQVLREARIFDVVAEENRRNRVKQLARIHHQPVVGHLYLADDLPLLRVAKIIQMLILLAIFFIAASAIAPKRRIGTPHRDGAPPATLLYFEASDRRIAPHIHVRIATNDGEKCGLADRLPVFDTFVSARWLLRIVARVLLGDTNQVVSIEFQLACTDTRNLGQLCRVCGPQLADCM
jgi:hypothetical protein